MNCGICSDNKYFNRACHMADGRLFTDYRPSGYVNNLMRMKFGMYGSNEYRQYLQTHAKEIMNENTDHYRNISRCDQWVIVPVEKTCYVDATNMSCSKPNLNGVGINYKGV